MSPSPPAVWHAEWAWLGDQGVVPDVLLEVNGDRFRRVEARSPVPPGAALLPGVTLPGLVNAHSHAFHRALRGRTEHQRGDFWTWREQMYRVAEVLDPDSYQALARAAYAEMALAGITTVAELHYLHHGPDGRSYADPNAMAEALRAAAADAGVRLTLLDTLYLRSGFERTPLDSVQRRYADADADAWTIRVEALATAWEGDQTARVGVGIHSVRAVDPGSMATAVRWAALVDAPLHVHVSEQPAENEACHRAYGCTPTELLVKADVLSPRTTAVHATHVDESDLDLLARFETAVCLCPTTERALADGVGPARAMAARGIPLALGSDSHSVIDLFEEARAAELDERLVWGTRGGLDADVLLAALTEHGARRVGWPDAGVLGVGRLADFTTVRLDSVRLAGSSRPEDLASAVVFAASAADVRDVVVGGRPVVRDGRHLLVDDVPRALDEAVAAVDERIRARRR